MFALTSKLIFPLKPLLKYIVHTYANISMKVDFNDKNILLLWHYITGNFRAKSVMVNLITYERGDGGGGMESTPHTIEISPNILFLHCKLVIFIFIF